MVPILIPMSSSSRTKSTWTWRYFIEGKDADLRISVDAWDVSQANEVINELEIPDYWQRVKTKKTLSGKLGNIWAVVLLLVLALVILVIVSAMVMSALDGVGWLPDLPRTRPYQSNSNVYLKYIVKAALIGLGTVLAGGLLASLWALITHRK